MLDGGFPLATESNILKEIVRPPNFLQSLTDAVTGKNTIIGSTLPTNQLSNIRWRRSGVNYTSNETYFDLIEKIDAIIDRSGYVISKEIHGSVGLYMFFSVIFAVEWSRTVISINEMAQWTDVFIDNSIY